MDRQEMLQNVSLHSPLETYLGDFILRGANVPSLNQSTRRIDIPIISEELATPSHIYLWDLFRTVLGFSGHDKYSRFMSVEDAEAVHAIGGISLLKMPVNLNLYDLATKYVSIIYVLSGPGRICIDGDNMPLKAGNTVIIEPDAKFSIEHMDSSGATFLLSISQKTLARHFYNAFSGMSAISGFLLEIAFRRPSAKYLLIRSDIDERLRDLVLDMLIEQEKRGDSSANILAGQIELFLCLLDADYGSRVIPSHEQRDTDRMASQILKYMRENYSDVSLETLSSHFFISSTHVSRVLKKKFGENYIQLLTEIRMKKAKDLLSVRGLSIESISGLLGYSDSRQFRRVFKETFDVSPSEFRECSFPHIIR
jgi:AraC-like DNA-binding protein